ncbi:MAG TPA: C13 family peptidase [Candidatus Cybelea sp.]|jgi:hypothetical protein|nr:C13 family peptidase [Candidatus Cybelea sp.]
MSKLFVFLFAGGVNSSYNYARYQNDLQRYGNLFATLPGVDGSTLTVMHADGTASFQFPNIASPTVLAATSSNLTNAFGTLASSIASTDRFVFVASNHGGRDANGSTLWCWNEENVPAASFAQACNNITSTQQAYIFGECYSGGFITPLAATNRIILTGSTDSQVTYATADVSYDEFLLRVIESLEGGERCLGNVFTAAKAADTQNESPQCSDTGGLGSQVSLLSGQ